MKEEQKKLNPADSAHQDCKVKKQNSTPMSILSSKKTLFCTVPYIFLLLFLLLYLPIYFNFFGNEVVVVGWEKFRSRDLRDYIQPEKVSAIIEKSSICASTIPILLLVVICSSVGNFGARNAIRETWASRANMSEDTLRLAFMLGETESADVQTKVSEESTKYGDVIQEGFLDSYKNLTLKSVMLLKWVRAHCRHALYVMKTDDDMFVNLPRLVSFLREDRLKTLSSFADPAEGRSTLLVGRLWSDAKPITNSRSKWYAQRYMYAEQRYPPFLSGTGYVMSAKVAQKLFETALQTPLFYLEDVFLTGICSAAAGIEPQHHPDFTEEKVPLRPCVYKNQVITSHGLSGSEMRAIWTQMQNPDLACSGAQTQISKVLIFSFFIYYFITNTLWK